MRLDIDIFHRRRAERPNAIATWRGVALKAYACQCCRADRIEEQPATTVGCLISSDEAMLNSQIASREDSTAVRCRVVHYGAARHRERATALLDAATVGQCFVSNNGDIR